MSTLVAVLSGGQDSSTSLAWAVEESPHTVQAAIHFQYGQEHSIEQECAKWWAEEYDLPLMEVPISSLEKVGGSALTGTLSDGMGEPHPNLEECPNTFVPGRNLVFFSLASAYAMKVGADAILTGVCQRDYSGYPDCREETLKPLRTAIREGMDFPELDIVAPLLNRTKPQTWALAAEADVVPDIVDHTHTCYKGERDERHEWGFGCGDCPSCEIRREGFYEWKTS
jgi:7-cyano-7-deazaguanine synthase